MKSIQAVNKTEGCCRMYVLATEIEQELNCELLLEGGC
jgi:hypothetical protein